MQTILKFVLLLLATRLLDCSPFCIQNFQAKGRKELATPSTRIHAAYDGDGDSELDDDDEEELPSTTATEMASNVLGTPLECCCSNVGDSGIGTGFYRNGYCSTGEQDVGRHTVCCQVTADFLAYSKKVGNDLSTPLLEYYFPGLQEGDIWCLCAQRWAQAYNDGMAPKIYLQATHEKMLEYVPFEILREYAIDKDEADDRLEKLNEMRDKLNKLL